VEVSDEEEVEDIDVMIDMPKFDEPVAPPIEFIEVPEEEAEVIHLIVEEQPSFEGGIEAFYRYISKNLKYPNTAKRIAVEGKVFLSFVIDKDGSITQVEVLKGIGGGCDEEAVRVLENAPRWNPGKQRGKAVKVRMQLPIVFALQ
jgi:protein TonB